jgi:hypothetical protein
VETESAGIALPSTQWMCVGTVCLSVHAHRAQQGALTPLAERGKLRPGG